jgi:hypothetical protein
MKGCGRPTGAPFVGDVECIIAPWTVQQIVVVGPEKRKLRMALSSVPLFASLRAISAVKDHYLI